MGLDIADGQPFTVTTRAIGWCFSTNRYDYDGPDAPFRVGEPFATPCRLSGHPEAAPIEPDRDVGLVVEDVFVWMDAAGLHGARVAR